MENQEKSTKTISDLIEETGLTQSKQSTLKTQFIGFQTIAKEWEAKAKKIVVRSIEDKELMEQAKEGRLLLKKKRVALEKLRKELKSDILKEGKAIDGVAKTLKELIEPIEKHLQEQEDFKKNYEAEKERKLIEKREKELSKYNVDTEYLSLGNMPQMKYNQLLEDGRILHEAKLKHEEEEERKRVADEKVAKEKEEKEQKERDEKLEAAVKIQEENEKLKKKNSNLQGQVTKSKNKIEKIQEEKIQEEKVEEKKTSLSLRGIIEKLNTICDTAENIGGVDMVRMDIIDEYARELEEFGLKMDEAKRRKS